MHHLGFEWGLEILRDSFPALSIEGQLESDKVMLPMEDNRCNGLFDPIAHYQLLHFHVIVSGGLCWKQVFDFYRLSSITNFYNVIVSLFFIKIN